MALDSSRRHTGEEAGASSPLDALDSGQGGKKCMIVTYPQQCA
jgi:hypothetical protein